MINVAAGEMLTLPSSGSEGAMAKVLEKVDLQKDGKWSSEVRAEVAKKQFLKILKGEDEVFHELKTGALRPQMKLLYQDAGLEIHQKREAGEALLGVESLKRLSRVYPSGIPERFALKVIGVSEEEGGVLSTILRYEACGAGERGPLQQIAHWKVTWKGDAVQSLQVLGFEETHALSEVGFRDATAAVFENVESFEEQLMQGTDYWRPRLTWQLGVDSNGMQGIALGDANGDGLEDLFVCQPGGLPDRLYLRNADGTLRDGSEAAGVNFLELTRGALFVDLDNDGDQDLALTQGFFYVVLENDGSGKFTKRIEERAEADLHSLTAADYDLDGDLDLYFCGRDPDGTENGVLGQPNPYHDANNGGPGILLRNEGEWAFSDVTMTSGIDQNNRRFSYACSWQDFDLDGDPDLYVANDFGRNNLYRNDGEKFTDVAAEMGIEDLSAGMGITWGDGNRDGRPDAYVSNMFSSAGNRIAYQRNFRDGDRADFQRHARGNSLFINQTEGFQDVLESGAGMARWAWGAKFADLNNDGWQDLYVGNGFITTEDTGDL